MTKLVVSKMLEDNIKTACYKDIRIKLSTLNAKRYEIITYL